MAAVWQQVLALDARYNAYRVPNNPQFRTLYIRRRSQLLRENAKCGRDPSVRKDYLKQRAGFLAQRYGPVAMSEQSSVRSRTLSLRSINPNTHESMDSLDTVGRKGERGYRYSYDTTQMVLPTAVADASSFPDDASMSLRFVPSSGWRTTHIPLMPTYRAGASRTQVRIAEHEHLQSLFKTSMAADNDYRGWIKAMGGDRTVSENYAFAGMCHIFDQHRATVTSVKFAHDDRSRLACSSLDGQISVCQLVPSPATVVCLLKGHTAGVTDFVWSQSNDLILSSSLDGTSRLWDVATETCIRTVVDLCPGAEVTSCLFQPLNNNWFVTGNNKSCVQVMNVSTGKVAKGGVSKVLGTVLALEFDVTGKILWSGDSQGFVFSFTFDIATGCITKAKRITVCEGYPVSCISARTWISREARDPSLLVNCGIHALCLFRITSGDGALVLNRTFPIRQRTHLIRSTFCPLMSFRQGACVVSGSEDMCVYFFDVEKRSQVCVNKLQGHSAVVTSVDFNHDESLLASADTGGTVIIWRREQKA